MLKSDRRYLNPYQEYYDEYKNNEIFDKDLWDSALKRGTLNRYVNDLAVAKEKGLDYKTLSSDMRFDLLDSDKRLFAIENALYADRVEQKERKVQEFDSKTNKYVEKVYNMSDFEWNNKLLKDEVDVAVAEEALRIEQERKDSASIGTKIAYGFATIPAVFAEALVGAADQIDSFTNIFMGITRGMEFMARGEGIRGAGVKQTLKDFGEGFKEAYKVGNPNLKFLENAGFQRALIEWENKYTYMRNVDGTYTSFGKYIGGVAYSIGQMLPTVALNLAGASTGANLSKISEGLYYAGMASKSFEEMVNNPDYASVEGYKLMLNATAKSVMEYIVQEGLNTILSPSNMDRLIFNKGGKLLTKSKKITTKTGIKMFFKDAFHEGLEETLQEYSGYFIDRFMGGIFKNNASFTFETAKDAFILGALSSIAISSFDMYIKKPISSKIDKIGDTRFIKNVLKTEEKYNISNDENIVGRRYIYDRSTEKIIDSRPKMNAFKGLVFDVTLCDLYNAYNNAMRKSTTDEERMQITGQMYATVRTLNSVYNTMSEERIKNAMNMLELMRSDPDKTSKDSVEYVLSEFNNMRNSYVKDIAKLMTEHPKLKGKKLVRLQSKSDGSNKSDVVVDAKTESQSKPKTEVERRQQQTQEDHLFGILQRAAEAADAKVDTLIENIAVVENLDEGAIIVGRETQEMIDFADLVFDSSSEETVNINTALYGRTETQIKTDEKRKQFYDKKRNEIKNYKPKEVDVSHGLELNTKAELLENTQNAFIETVDKIKEDVEYGDYDSAEKRMQRLFNLLDTIHTLTKDSAVTLVVDEQLARTADSENAIIKVLSENELRDTIINDPIYASSVEELVKLYRQVTGLKEATVEEVVSQILFNDDKAFINSIVWSANERVYALLTHLESWRKRIATNNRIDEQVADKLDRVIAKLHKSLFEYTIAIDGKYAHLEMFNDKEKERINTARWIKDSGQAIVTKGELTINEKGVLVTSSADARVKNFVKTLNQMINAIPNAQEKQKIVNGLTSDNKAARSRAMSRISNRYKNIFNAQYDGRTYLSIGPVGNNAFNLWMQHNSLTIESILQTMQNPPMAGPIADFISAHSELSPDVAIGIFYQNSFMASTGNSFIFNIENGQIHVQAFSSEIAKSLNTMPKITFGKEMYATDNVVIVAAETANGESLSVMYGLTNDENATLSDIIYDQNLLTESAREEIRKNNDGKITPQGTFVYIRDKVISESGGDRTVLVSGDNFFYFADISKASALVPVNGANGVRVSNAYDKLARNETIEAKDIVGKQFLQGRLTDTKLVKDSASYYDMDNNIIHISLGSNLTEFVSTLRHEFKHVFMLDILGLSGFGERTFLQESARVPIVDELIADTKRYVPELFDEKNLRLVMGEQNYAEIISDIKRYGRDAVNDKIERLIVGCFIYDTCQGEFVSYGLDVARDDGGNLILKEYPNVVNKNGVTMFWGKTYDFANGKSYARAFETERKYVTNEHDILTKNSIPAASPLYLLTPSQYQIITSDGVYYRFPSSIKSVSDMNIKTDAEFYADRIDIRVAVDANGKRVQMVKLPDNVKPIQLSAILNTCKYCDKMVFTYGSTQIETNATEGEVRQALGNIIPDYKLNAFTFNSKAGLLNENYDEIYDTFLEYVPNKERTSASKFGFIFPNGEIRYYNGSSEKYHHGIIKNLVRENVSNDLKNLVESYFNNLIQIRLAQPGTFFYSNMIRFLSDISQEQTESLSNLLIDLSSTGQRTSMSILNDPTFEAHEIDQVRNKSDAESELNYFALKERKLKVFAFQRQPGSPRRRVTKKAVNQNPLFEAFTNKDPGRKYQRDIPTRVFDMVNSLTQEDLPKMNAGLAELITTGTLNLQTLNDFIRSEQSLRSNDPTSDYTLKLIQKFFYPNENIDNVETLEFLNQNAAVFSAINNIFKIMRSDVESAREQLFNLVTKLNKLQEIRKELASADNPRIDQIKIQLQIIEEFSTLVKEYADIKEKRKDTKLNKKERNKLDTRYAEVQERLKKLREQAKGLNEKTLKKELTALEKERAAKLDKYKNVDINGLENEIISLEKLVKKTKERALAAEKYVNNEERLTGKMDKAFIDALRTELENDPIYGEHFKGTLARFGYGSVRDILTGKNSPTQPLDFPYGALKALYLKIWKGTARSAAGLANSVKMIVQLGYQEAGSGTRRRERSIFAQSGATSRSGDEQIASEYEGLLSDDSTAQEIDNLNFETKTISQLKDAVILLQQHAYAKELTEKLGDEKVRGKQAQEHMLKKFYEISARISEMESYDELRKLYDKLRNANKSSEQTAPIAKQDTRSPHMIANQNRSYLQIINMNLTNLAQRRSFVEKNPKIFALSKNKKRVVFNSVVNEKSGSGRRYSINSVKNVDYLIKLNNLLRKALDRVQKGSEARGKRLSQRFEAMQRSLEEFRQERKALLSELDNMQQALLLQQSEMRRLQMQSTNIDYVSPVPMPAKLKTLMETMFDYTDKTSKNLTEYLGLDDEQHTRVSLDEFINKNTDTLNQLTTEDCEEMIEFFATSTIYAGDKYDARLAGLRMMIMGYIKHLSDKGMIDLFPESVKTLTESMHSWASTAGTVLQMFNQVMNHIEPETIIVNSLMRQYGVEVQPENVRNLTRALYSKNADAIAEAKMKLLDDARQNLKDKGRRNIFDTLWKIQRMFMLSAPGTWIRNIVSNSIVEGVNIVAGGIGKFVTSKSKTREGQYTIVGTKVSDEIASVVNTHLVQNGLYKDIVDGLNKYSGDELGSRYDAARKRQAKLKESIATAESELENLKKRRKANTDPDAIELLDRDIRRKEKNIEKLRERLEKADTGDFEIRLDRDQSKEATANILTDSIARAVISTYVQENQFDNEALNKIHKLLFKMLSDDPWIKRRSLWYVNRMLQEDYEAGRFKITEDTATMQRAVLLRFADAYAQASYDYMHRQSFVSKIEKTMRQNLGAGAFFVYKQLFPFATAGMNWFLEGLKLTPVGLGKAIYDYVRLEHTLAKMKTKSDRGDLAHPYSMSQYVLRRNLGKGIIGTIGTVIGLLLSAFGIAAIDREDEKVKFRIGDVYIDVTDVFGTSGLMFGMTAAAMWNEGDRDFTKFVDALGTQIFDGSIYADVVDMLRYNNSIGSFLLSQPSSFLSKFIPNILKMTAQFTYKDNIKYKSTNSLMRSFERTLVTSIPFLAQTWPKSVDPYTGKVNTAYAFGTVGGYTMKIIDKLSPLSIKRYSISNNERTAIDLGVAKGELTGKYKDSIGYDLSAEDTQKLNTFYGQLNDKDLTAFYNNKMKVRVQMKDGSFKELTYNKMTDEQRKNATNTIMSKNATYAKIYVYTQNGGKYYASETEYAALKKLGIKTNVYKATEKKKGFN